MTETTFVFVSSADVLSNLERNHRRINNRIIRELEKQDPDEEKVDYLIEAIKVLQDGIAVL